MTCPKCKASDTGRQVIDSRKTDNGATIRRRRVCPHCEHRWTTYEREEEKSQPGQQEQFEAARVLARATLEKIEQALNPVLVYEQFEAQGAP